MFNLRSHRSLPRSSYPAAVAVRLGAFLVAALGLAAIPATLFAASTGHLSSQATLLTIGGATLLVIAAAFAAQSVDPLRS